MAKNVYAVTYQVEQIHTKKDDKGKLVVVRRGHGGEFTESVIASSSEAASSYVRSKHTSSAQNVLRCNAQLVLANLQHIPVVPDPDEKEEPVVAGEKEESGQAATDGEDSALDND